MPTIVDFPTIVKDAVDVFGELFANEPARRHFAEYLTGLIVAANKTVSGINGAFVVTTDQSCLNRWLNEVTWDVQALNDRRLAWLQGDPKTRYSPRGVIAIDNTLVDHAGKLIEDVGQACAAFHDETVRGVKAKRVQVDEIWSFTYAKQRNVASAKAAPDGAGDTWTWTGLDADSKLIISWHIGARDGYTARLFIDDLKSRLANRVQLTSDGHRAYLEAVEDAFIPFGEDFSGLGGGHAEDAGHQGVSFADHLHVAVFDAVVDHFDVVARAVGTDVGGAGDSTGDWFSGRRAGEGLAGFGVDFRGDGSPDGLNFFPGGDVAAGHEGGAEAGALFTAGDAGADEAEALFPEGLLAADGVGPQGVAAVDDDVVLLEKWHEAVDHGVGGLAGLDEDDDLAGAGEGGDELLQRLRADEAAGGVRVFGDDLDGFMAGADQGGIAGVRPFQALLQRAAQEAGQHAVALDDIERLDDAGAENVVPRGFEVIAELMPEFTGKRRDCASPAC